MKRNSSGALRGSLSPGERVRVRGRGRPSSPEIRAVPFACSPSRQPSALGQEHPVAWLEPHGDTRVADQRPTVPSLARGEVRPARPSLSEGGGEGEATPGTAWTSRASGFRRILGLGLAASLMILLARPPPMAVMPAAASSSASPTWPASITHPASIRVRRSSRRRNSRPESRGTN